MSNQDVLSVSGAICYRVTDGETVNRIHFNIMRIHVIRHMSAFSPLSYCLLLFKSQGGHLKLLDPNLALIEEALMHLRNLHSQMNIFLNQIAL